MSAELVIVDIAGRRVKTLHMGQLEPDSYSVAWDGKDESGHSVKSGVYFVTFKSSFGQLSRRVVVL